METVQTYWALSRSSSRAEFIQRHPHPFLVKDARLLPTDLKKSSAFETLSAGGGLPLPAPSAAPASPSQCAVWKILKKETNRFDGMVNVGRTSTNDVVLDFQVVSKFHAFFTPTVPPGGCQITDPGSTNGTFVQGRKLEPKVKRALEDGDEISFGNQVSFTYYSAGGFYDLLGRLE